MCTPLLTHRPNAKGSWVAVCVLSGLCVLADPRSNVQFVRAQLEAAGTRQASAGSSIQSWHGDRRRDSSRVAISVIKPLCTWGLRIAFSFRSPAGIFIKRTHTLEFINTSQYWRIQRLYDFLFLARTFWVCLWVPETFNQVLVGGYHWCSARISLHLSLKWFSSLKSYNQGVCGRIGGHIYWEVATLISHDDDQGDIVATGPWFEGGTGLSG